MKKCRCFFSFKNIYIFCISCSEWNMGICPCGFVCVCKPVMNINHQVKLISVKRAMYVAVDFRIWAMCFLSFSASLLERQQLEKSQCSLHYKPQIQIELCLHHLWNLQGFSCKRVRFLLALRSLSAELS